MCPEFLREGSSVADFFAPPFVVLGTTDAKAGGAVAAVLLPRRRAPHISVGTAEALKYACNAFHATKISFANEMGRIFGTYGSMRVR